MEARQEFAGISGVSRSRAILLEIANKRLFMNTT